MLQRWKNVNISLPLIDIKDIFEEQPQLNHGKIV